MGGSPALQAGVDLSVEDKLSSARLGSAEVHQGRRGVEKKPAAALYWWWWSRRRKSGRPLRSRGAAMEMGVGLGLEKLVIDHSSHSERRTLSGDPGRT